MLLPLTTSPPPICAPGSSQQPPPSLPGAPSTSHTSLVMWWIGLSLPLDCEISQVSDSAQALILSRSSSLPTSQKKIPTTSLHPNPPAICISPFFHHSCPNKGIPSYLRPSLRVRILPGFPSQELFSALSASPSCKYVYMLRPPV